MQQRFLSTKYIHNTDISYRPYQHSHLFKLLQFDLILKISVCWNVMVHTSNCTVRILGFDFQQWLLTLLTLLDGLFNAVNNTDLRRLADHKVDVTVLKLTTFVSADNVNCTAQTRLINITDIQQFHCYINWQLTLQSPMHIVFAIIGSVFYCYFHYVCCFFSCFV